jgi:hypothetical protein
MLDAGVVDQTIIENGQVLGVDNANKINPSTLALSLATLATQSNGGTPTKQRYKGTMEYSESDTDTPEKSGGR